jgi:hypothetical protein
VGQVVLFEKKRLDLTALLIRDGRVVPVARKPARSVEQTVPILIVGSLWQKSLDFRFLAPPSVVNAWYWDSAVLINLLWLDGELQQLIGPHDLPKLLIGESPKWHLWKVLCRGIRLVQTK